MGYPKDKSFSIISHVTADVYKIGKIKRFSVYHWKVRMFPINESDANIRSKNGRRAIIFSRN